MPLYPPSGNVVGPTSSTDNALVRWDTTTGKLVQNSVVTIADNGDMIDAGRLAFGSDATIGLSGGANKFFDFEQTVTDFSGTDFWGGAAFIFTLNPSASMASKVFYGNNAAVYVQAGNAQPILAVTGWSSEVRNNGAGNIAQLIGAISDAYQQGTAGTATDVIGVSGNASNQHAGSTSTNLVGGSFKAWVFAGSATNSIGVNILSPTSGSSLFATNVYGLKIEDQTLGTNIRAIKTGLGLVEFGDGLFVGNNLDATQVAAKSYNEFAQTITAPFTPGDTYIDQLLNYSVVNLAANQTSLTINGLDSVLESSAANTKNLGTLNGIINTVNHKGSGTFVTINGGYYSASNTSTGVGTSVIGGNFSFANTGAGSATNGIGVNVVSPAAVGSNGNFTNTYGVKVADITVGTNKWAIKTGLGLVEFGDNVVIGASTAGSSAVKVLALSNNSTAPSNSVDLVQLYGVDLSAGNATLGLFTETAVAVDAALISTSSLTVKINGTNYKLMLA